MKTTPHFFVKTTAIAITTIALGISTGCSTLKNLTDKKEKVVSVADKSDHDYYREAQNSLDRKRYREAIAALNNIRTFYPTSPYAQQALLDLIYAHYQAKDFEAVTAHTSEFITLYPNSTHLDYALYVQGVTNMGGAPNASRLFHLDQSQRDVSYLRLAFADFSALLHNFPNSPYATDAAQRMIAIYNDFAEHELVSARWYVKRDAYVAAANRAKWVFQYFPQSEGTAEAIAILAYSNQKLGLTDTAQQYKTLLQINYPHYLTHNNNVRLNTPVSLGKKALASMSFGKFGRAKDKTHETGQIQPYHGATKTQIIHKANSLQLPKQQTDIVKPTNTPNTTRHFGLGLPPAEAEAGHTNNR